MHNASALHPASCQAHLRFVSHFLTRTSRLAVAVFPATQAAPALARKGILQGASGPACHPSVGRHCTTTLGDNRQCFGQHQPTFPTAASDTCLYGCPPAARAPRLVSIGLRVAVPDTVLASLQDWEAAGQGAPGAAGRGARWGCSQFSGEKRSEMSTRNSCRTSRGTLVRLHAPGSRRRHATTASTAAPCQAEGPLDSTSSLCGGCHALGMVVILYDPIAIPYE